jgi:hypothetical protein
LVDLTIGYFVWYSYGEEGKIMEIALMGAIAVGIIGLAAFYISETWGR